MLRFASPALKNSIGRFADRFALARISTAHVSNAWLTAFVKTKMLIGIVLLQLVGANVGAHQLHPDTKVEEGGQHSHLQLTTQVTSLSQCDIGAHLDAHANGSEHDFADFHGAANYGEPSHTDSHLVTSTETQEVDICLDCQCHGGHASLICGLTPLAPLLLTDSPVLLAFAYYPPESLPSYRPPIV